MSNLFFTSPDSFQVTSLAFQVYYDMLWLARALSQNITHNKKNMSDKYLKHRSA